MAKNDAAIRAKYEARVVAQQLRKCSEDDKVADYCRYCQHDDGVHNCMDHLHITAADLLEKLAAMVN